MINKDNIDDLALKLFEEYEKSYNDRINRIAQAELPSFLLDNLPIVIIGKESTLNIIYGDSGVGKATLNMLNQSIIKSVLERDTEKKYFVLWFDLEFQNNAPKQCSVNELIKGYEDRFRLIQYTQETAEKFYNTTGREWTNTRIVGYLANGYHKKYPDKRLLVFVNPLQDFIDDISDDREVTSILSRLLSLNNVFFIFSHYADKKSKLFQSFTSRKLTVFKRKADSMIYVEKKTEPDDKTIEYTLEITKIRTLWHGERKVLITVEKPELQIKSIYLNSNSLERKVLQSAYFILKKENELAKTELIERISKETKTNFKTIRSIINKNIDLFSVKVLAHNKHTFKINEETLNSFHVAIGLNMSSDINNIS